MRKTIRVLIVDDQPRAREGLRALLQTWPNLEIVGEAADSHGAVACARALHPDLVLMDIKMPLDETLDADSPALGGIHATRCIKTSVPGARVLVLTMFGGHREAAMRAGADDFMLKGGDPEQLVETICRCACGDAS